MPQAKFGKGYTHWSPFRPMAEYHFEPVPRLIHSEARAKKIAAEWAGRNNTDGKRKEDLEIVKVRLIVVE